MRFRSYYTLIAIFFLLEFTTITKSYTKHHAGLKSPGTQLSQGRARTKFSSGIKSAPSHALQDPKFVTFETAKNNIPNAMKFMILGGFTDSELEVIDDVVATVIRDGTFLPSIVLGAADRKRKLSYFFDEKILQERDHELPERPFVVTVPLVIYSGLQAGEIKTLMYSIRENFASTFGENKRNIVFALAVKNAFEKSMDTLYSEILGDYEENRNRA